MVNDFLRPNVMEPIDSGSVVDKILLQIRNAITSGRFTVGQKLPSEFELMDELKVSRNSLREAMKILSAMGVVEIRRGDGTYICDNIKPRVMDNVIYSVLMESSSADEIIELRQTLDEDVLMLAMHKCTDEQIQNLEELVAGMRRSFEEGDISKAAQLDYQFHLYLAECCQNKLLSHIVNGIYGIFENSIENNIRTERLFAQADQHHQEMLDCLKAKDDSRVREVISHSLSSWKENVKK